MKQKNLEANIFFTIIFAFVILFIMINFVLMGINYTKEDEAIQIGIECYGSYGSQCALHNIFEEGDFEDQNIETTISWLETNEFDLSDSDVKKGLHVARYLLSLTIEERQEYIRKVHRSYNEQHIQNN